MFNTVSINLHFEFANSKVVCKKSSIRFCESSSICKVSQRCWYEL